MSTVSYKCPNCAGPLQFQPERQKMKCDYCLSEFTDQELVRINRELEAKAAETKADHVVGYVCNSCGAEVVTEEQTSATFCYYCHNPVLISERLSGEFRPDKIIPFTFNKDQAVESFLNWAKGKSFIPKDFTSASQLEKITGLYIPYWEVDVETQVNFKGKGTNRRIWRTGDTEHTETQEFVFERQGRAMVSDLPEIAMRKLEKDLLDSIAPYDESQAVPFSLSYLSGFFAEKYELNQAEAEPMVEEKVKGYAAELIQDTIQGYQSVSLDESAVDILEARWSYILKPVWVLTYLYEGKNYVYAVNGQNGKAYGELPVNKKKLGLTSALLTAGIFVVGILGGSLIW